VPLPTATPTATPEPPRAPVIVLDPGHDASSGGALGIEYQLVLQTALATQAVLEAAGYQVLLTRPDNATILRHDPSLLPPNAASMDPGYVEGYAHATRALQLDPDLILSLHYNGSPSPDARGLTVYYCEHGGSQNQQLAELVRDELLVALRSVGYEPPYAQATEDGAIGKVYGHLATLGNVYRAPFELEHNRMPGIPVVLTEPLFLTNASELALIQRPETHQAFALAYLRAINRYFGR
jgi:N-acetylmuramoyl-L-alanine amidase